MNKRRASQRRRLIKRVRSAWTELIKRLQAGWKAFRSERERVRLELLIACSRQGRRIPAAARDPK